MQNLQRIKHYADSANFGNFTTGYTEPCAQISRSSGQGLANWVDFAQFAVNLTVPFTMVRNGKWFANFTLFARIVGFLVTWGVYLDF